MGLHLAGAVPRLLASRFRERTVPSLLVAAARDATGRRFLRFVEPDGGLPRELTFGGFAAGVSRAVLCLRESGLGAGGRVLLLAENSPEWQMIALGAQFLRAEPAALFASLGAEQVTEIARRVAPTILFVSTAAQWSKLAPEAGALADRGLRAVIAGEALAPEQIPAGIVVVALDEVLSPARAGQELDSLERLASEVGEEDPFLLLFTSGTTGRAKGVRLPQRAIVHAVESAPHAIGTTSRDVGLHFLPFGHVAGHDQFVLALAQRHELIMTARREDLERGLALAPTYLFSVPLVFERIREAIERRLDRMPSPLARSVRAALAAAERVRLRGSRRLRDRSLARVADRLLGRAVRRRLGGAVDKLFVGGAPASPGLFRFFEALGLPFVELYGMSETAGMISSNLLAGPRRPACAGRVSPFHEARIEVNGELVLRGPMLLSGYLDPEDDAAAWTADGYFRTGDLARIDGDGFLSIEGRCKNLLVLATGKKIAPEPIEQALVAAPPFRAAMLLGDGMPFVAAAVFVAREELQRLADEGKDAASALLPVARAKLAEFSDYEIPKRLLVVPGAPEEHEGLLTPTLKLRREALLRTLGEAVPAIFGAALQVP